MIILKTLFKNRLFNRKINDIYCIDNNKIINISYYYNFILLLLLFINKKYICKLFRKSKYLVIYSNRREIYYDTILNIIDIINNKGSDYSIRKPLYNKRIIINDKELSFKDKNEIFYHDYDDNIFYLYKLYKKDCIYKIECNEKIWNKNEICDLKIRDILE